MLFKNEENATVEIADGISEDAHGNNIEVWLIETKLTPLPPDLWHSAVPKSNPHGREVLEKFLANWAAKNGFLCVPN